MIKISLKSQSYLGLLFTILGLLVIMPFIEVGDKLLDNLIISVFFLLFLISTLKAISTRGISAKKNYFKWSGKIIVLIAFIANVGGTVLQTLIPEAGGDTLVERISEILSGIALFDYSLLILFLIIIIIKDLFSGEKVTVDKIYGAIVSYLLLGLMWSCLYTAINTINPDAIIKSSGAHLNNFAEMQYFSFTTLCTLGYGDIIPNRELTMVLSNLEAIVGSLYLAILVARLVGLYTGQGSQEKLSAALREINNRNKKNPDKE